MFLCMEIMFLCMEQVRVGEHNLYGNARHGIYGVAQCGGVVV